MKITIKEIAREAGVSIATVSNYLNGKGVKKETGKRIEEAILRVGCIKRIGEVIVDFILYN